MASLLDRVERNGQTKNRRENGEDQKERKKDGKIALVWKV
jgi:hypothetical protein